MSAAAPATPQVEADRRLLQFETYDDYLDSLTTPQDHCFLQSTTTSRTLAELGYRYTKLLLDLEKPLSSFNFSYNFIAYFQYSKNHLDGRSSATCY